MIAATTDPTPIQPRSSAGPAATGSTLLHDDQRLGESGRITDDVAEPELAHVVLAHVALRYQSFAIEISGPARAASGWRIQVFSRVVGGVRGVDVHERARQRLVPSRAVLLAAQRLA